MSAADGFLTPGAPHAELERRYRRLLRLYPREFRARRADEMIGVLMASAADGQNRPARGDVSDIVRGSLLARLRGPRGGWPFALSAFALAAPLFLVLADILQVAFPYSESQAPRISVLEAHGVPAAGIPQSVLVPQHVGGLQLLSQPDFLVLVAGHLVVAAAVIAGSRRTALAALVIAAAADYTQWTALHVLRPGTGTLAFLTIAVFPLEAIALASAGPRAARRREGWQHVLPALALARGAAQLLDASRSGPAATCTCPPGTRSRSPDACWRCSPCSCRCPSALAGARACCSPPPATRSSYWPPPPARPPARPSAGCPSPWEWGLAGPGSAHGHRDHPVPPAGAGRGPGRGPDRPHETTPQQGRPRGLARSGVLRFAGAPCV